VVQASHKLAVKNAFAPVVGHFVNKAQAFLVCFPHFYHKQQVSFDFVRGGGYAVSKDWKRYR
jgi:hypothetical protein